ncbi:DeoR/GlpR transcriptional regulator [Alicyclobacillus sp. TC]|uniref:Transcriptional regulator, DeoR family n=1 Tax=Alicyclobacillus tolerans TaxID=90970 RepID=A0A1M6NLE5_9BACL|nr:MULTISPECIES: DeoR/GlpR family DNA-binding transcription regulator [Alicyclobacillus]QRF23921.1 DeoR/GlpR transcriptional regulator [Alicyclobacillus sp. TC]SHJ96414.1 transcriptional regulator, DeoR family [Alicyclobacillus montanus]
MLPAERQRAIVQLVNTRGSVRVKELSQIFEVTEETVRRDLDSLEMDGKLRRSHGGAVRIYEEQSEIPYLEREIAHVAEKQAIAREAVRHIFPGDRIILDASTTAWHLAAALPDIQLTVLTNSLKVAFELSQRDKIEVISTGGILRTSSLSYVGPMAEEALDQFHVGKAFLSCKGLHSHYGISESNALQALVKRKMIEIAERVYILADHSKIQVRDFTSIASLDEVDVLITDLQVREEQIEDIRKFGVEVFQV